VPSPSLSVRSTAVSGTCFTQTTMFRDNVLPLSETLFLPGLSTTIMVRSTVMSGKGTEE
jgi:hypothetical protein